MSHVLSAFYGNLTYTIPIDPPVGGAVGDGQFEFGRDGKLTNDHPYLSAIALLRRREHRADRIHEIAEEERGDRDPADFEEAATQAGHLLQRLEREQLPEGDYVWVDVIETVSDAGIALPDSWFAGPNDTRWRMAADGRSSACGALVPE